MLPANWKSLTLKYRRRFNFLKLNNKSWLISGKSGFTLTEVIIVITILIVTLSIASTSFNKWVTKSKLESQTRQILTDLNDARTSALTQKRVYGIVFNPSSYVMKSYSSESQYTPIYNAVSQGQIIFTRNLVYNLTKAGASITDTPVLFDITGFTNNWFTIYVNPITVDSAFNCIVISAARANMGKVNGTSCDFK